ncbi:MAG: adenylate/guanylate cyclase domain-containing protein [Burkholderiaceae bacterium]
MPSSSEPNSLSQWLAGLGLHSYTSAFVDNDIGFALLPDITADDLRDIGINSVGHRRILLQAIAALTPPSEVAVASPVPALNMANAKATALPVNNHQHRLLTVMFCDLVGSTELSGRLDAEDLQNLLQAYRECLRAVVQKHRGYIAQFLGDGVLVYFGYPSISESDCERALRAALDAQRAIQGVQPIAGVQLQVRMGVATGTVVIGQLVGAGDTHEIGAVGETPNLAARLQGLAAPGGIVVSQATRDAAGDLFAFRSRETVAVKGSALPLNTWELLSEQQSQSRFHATRGRRRIGPLIGRDVELNFLRDKFERSRNGRGQAILLRGDAGTGKSHLITRLYADLGADGQVVPVLQCSPDYSQTPLYPFIQHMEAFAKIRREDSDTEKQRKLETIAVQYGVASDEDLFALSELLGLRSISEPHMAGLNADTVRSRIQGALLRGLHSLVRERTLLVVEDLHWADPSTNELLSKFVSELPRQSAMLIATSRPTKDKMFSDGAHVSVLHLDRLPEADIRAIVTALAAPRLMPEAIMRQIVDRSDGVPIFATELAHALLLRDDFDNPVGARGIPSTLSDILLARLDQLQHGRMTVQQAAVLGREFDQSLLVACASDLMEDTQAAIEELLDTQLFVQRNTPNGVVLSFDHMLVKDAVYQRMLRADRVRLHAKVAQVMEQQFAVSITNAPHLLAQHYLEAGNLDRAAYFWERAGELAANQLAPKEAVAHYSQALEVLAQMPESPQRDERELVISMDLAGPLIATRGVGSRKLVNVVERAYALCQRLPGSPYQVSVHYLKWSVALGGWNLADLRALALQVQTAAQGQDDIARLLAHRAMGFTCMIQGELSAAQNAFESFLALYSPELHANSINFRFSSNNHLCSVLLALATTCALRNLTDAASHWRDQALLHAQRSHNHLSICQSLVFCGGHISGLLRRPEDMARYASEAHDYASKHHLPIWAPYTDLITALSLLMRPVSSLHAAAYLEKAKACIEILLTQHSAYLTTWVVFYARACLAHGRIQDGLDALARIEERVHAGERWMEPEYLRLRARLQHTQAEGDPLVPHHLLREALALAYQQDALAFVEAIGQDIQQFAPSANAPLERSPQ